MTMKNAKKRYKEEQEYYDKLKEEHKNDPELLQLIEDQELYNGAGGTSSQWQDLERRKASARAVGKNIWW